MGVKIKDMLDRWMPASRFEVKNSKDQILMKLNELAGKVTEVSTALNAVGDQLTKATAEIIASLENVEIPAEAQAALDGLAGIGVNLKAASQKLDDITPDAP